MSVCGSIRRLRLKRSPRSRRTRTRSRRFPGKLWIPCDVTVCSRHCFTFATSACPVAPRDRNPRRICNWIDDRRSDTRPSRCIAPWSVDIGCDSSQRRTHPTRSREGRPSLLHPRDPARTGARGQVARQYGVRCQCPVRRVTATLFRTTILAKAGAAMVPGIIRRLPRRNVVLCATLAITDMVHLSISWFIHSARRTAVPAGWSALRRRRLTWAWPRCARAVAALEFAVIGTALPNWLIT